MIEWPSYSASRRSIPKQSMPAISPDDLQLIMFVLWASVIDFGLIQYDIAMKTPPELSF